MTDPADRFLEEGLHTLARGAHAPIVPPEDDVRRGRRRLLRMRMAMAGATTATVAVVLGITSLTAGAPKADEVPEVTQPPSTLKTTTPTTSPSTDRSDDAKPGQHQRQGAGDQPAAPPAVDPSRGDATSLGGHQMGDAPTNASTVGGGPRDGTSPGHPHQPAGTQGFDITELPEALPTTTLTPTPAETPTSTPTGTATPTSAPTGLPTQTPTDPGTGVPTDPPTSPPPTLPTAPPTPGGKVRVPRVLRYYNDVLAELLDPERTQLQPYDRQLDAKQTSRVDGQLYALGSAYRWGTGHSPSGLTLTVASGWDQVDWSCGATYADWACHAAPTGAGVAEVAVHDGLRQVAVEHADGHVVVLTDDVDGASTEGELVAAAADDRLVLPGDTPLAPPTIDGAGFVAAGVAALVRPGESFVQTSLDRSPAVRGTRSVDGTERGTLAWSAKPTYSGAGFTCSSAYRSCTTVVVDDSGTTVHLALLKKGAGGGWVVQYDGPSYAVRVYSSDRTFPKKRAYPFVTDGAWQPVR